MDTNSTTVNRFKMQVNKFSGILAKKFSKTKKRFLKEMLYGIQASKDIKLSNVARALQEQIPLIKTEDRLSRNLNQEDLTSDINGEILRLSKDKIDKDIVIAIDPGEIMKPYARSMEKLCAIYDGSEKKPAQGYNLCQVTAANLQQNKLVPLYNEVFSSEEEGYVDKTEKVKGIISRVAQIIGKSGTWAMDREGDDIGMIEHFEKEGLEFVIRLKLNRYVHYGHNTYRQVQVDHIDRFVNLKYSTQVVKLEGDKIKTYTLKYGVVAVALPEAPSQWYHLVIIRGFGKHPMLLLTNKQINIHSQKALYTIIEIYLTRWKCEECYRYIKQSYNLEDLRVRGYNAIRNIIVLVNAIAYFCSVYMGMAIKLKLLVNKIFILAKRFFGVPVFYNYAMADGIFEMLKSTRSGIINFKGKIGLKGDELQLSLFPD